MGPLRVLVAVLFVIALAAPVSASASRVSAHASIELTQDTDQDGFPDLTDQCPTVPGIFNGCPTQVDPTNPGTAVDSDRDGIQDSLDQCPTVPYSGAFVPGVPLGCPPASGDSDRDGVADAFDNCPTVPGGTNGVAGCPAVEVIDSDGDGVPDTADRCANTRPNVDYPGETAGPNGCPPLLVNFFYNVTVVDFLIADEAGSVVADCAYNLGVPCVMNATVSLAAKTARAAHLRQRVISRLTIQLTTPRQQDDAHPQFYKVQGGNPRPGTLRLRLSRAVKRKLKKLRSVTMTVTASYRLGDALPVSIGSDKCTLYRDMRRTSTCRLTNAPVDADKVSG